MQPENCIIGTSPDLDRAIERIVELEGKKLVFVRRGADISTFVTELDGLNASLLKMDELYKIPASREDLENLGRIFNVNFVIGAGLDRSQMIGVAPDRTAFACVARGIVDENTSYYFLLDLFLPTTSSGAALQERLIEWTSTYGWVDKVVIETFQGQDFYNWCIEKGYEAEFIYASYKNQKLTFTNMFMAVNGGYFKAATVPYYTDEAGNLYPGYTNKEDIFVEEMSVFTHAEGKWFGAPEKRMRRGAPKDDTIYAVNWAMHATQGESAIDLINRQQAQSMTDVHINSDVIGRY